MVIADEEISLFRQGQVGRENVDAPHDPGYFVFVIFAIARLADMVLGQAQQLREDQKRRSGSGADVAIFDGGAYRAHGVALRFSSRAKSLPSR